MKYLFVFIGSLLMIQLANAQSQTVSGTLLPKVGQPISILPVSNTVTTQLADTAISNQDTTPYIPPTQMNSGTLLPKSKQSIELLPVIRNKAVNVNGVSAKISSFNQNINNKISSGNLLNKKDSLANVTSNETVEVDTAWLLHKRYEVQNKAATVQLPPVQEKQQSVIESFPETTVDTTWLNNRTGSHTKNITSSTISNNGTQIVDPTMSETSVDTAWLTRKLSSTNKSGSSLNNSLPVENGIPETSVDTAWLLRKARDEQNYSLVNDITNSTQPKSLANKTGLRARTITGVLVPKAGQSFLIQPSDQAIQSDSINTAQVTSNTNNSIYNFNSQDNYKQQLDQLNQQNNGNNNNTQILLQKPTENRPNVLDILSEPQASTTTVPFKTDLRAQVVNTGIFLPKEGTPIIIQPSINDSLAAINNNNNNNVINNYNPSQQSSIYTYNPLTQSLPQALPQAYNPNNINTYNPNLSADLVITFFVTDKGSFSINFSNVQFALSVSQTGQVYDFSIRKNGNANNSKVTYNYLGMVESVGNTQVSYNYDHTVHKIGDVVINYDYEKWVNRIGEMKISYNSNGSVNKIAGYKVTYDYRNLVMNIDESNGLILYRPALSNNNPSPAVPQQ